MAKRKKKYSFQMTKTYYKRLVKSTIYKNNQDYKQKYNPDCFPATSFDIVELSTPCRLLKLRFTRKT